MRVKNFLSSKIRFLKSLVRRRQFISIAPFRDDRPAALSVTFDDGSQDHYAIAAPLLEDFGYRGTFFILPGLTRETKSDPMIGGSSLGKWGGVSWQEWKELETRGHEVANHSLTHQKLTELPDHLIADDIGKSAALIQSKVGHAPVSFAYPWNQFNERVRRIALKFHLVSRDFQEIFAVNDDLPEMRATVTDAVERQIWKVAMVHGINEIPSDRDNRTCTIEKKIFLYFLEELKKAESQLWVDTFGNVGRYSEEYANTKIQILKKTKNEIEFTLSCPLDQALFSVPLTVVVRPSIRSLTKVGAVLLRSGEKIIDSKIVRENEIHLNIKPNSGVVRVYFS